MGEACGRLGKVQSAPRGPPSDALRHVAVTLLQARDGCQRGGLSDVTQLPGSPLNPELKPLNPNLPLRDRSEAVGRKAVPLVIQVTFRRGWNSGLCTSDLFQLYREVLTLHVFCLPGAFWVQDEEQVGELKGGRSLWRRRTATCW